MRTRVKEIKYKNFTDYIPQVKWLFWWFDVNPDQSYNNVEAAKAAIDDRYEIPAIKIYPHTNQ